MDFNKNKALRFKPLAKINLEEMPEPMTWHILVQPYETEAITTGGYHITESDRTDYTKTHCVAKILKMGELCFQTDAFKGTKPFAVDDIVFIARHNVQWINWNGTLFGFLADDRAMMKVSEKALLQNFDGFQNQYDEYKE